MKITTYAKIPIPLHLLYGEIYLRTFVPLHHQTLTVGISFQVVQTQTTTAYIVEYYLHWTLLDQLLCAIKPQSLAYTVYILYVHELFHCRAISSMLFTLLFPIIPWLLQLIIFAWFVAVGVYPFAGKQHFSSVM